MRSMYTEMSFKHFEHALRSKGEKRNKKYILSAARKGNKFIFFCFKPI